MAEEQFEIPASWELSAQEEVVVGSMLDEAGRYLSAAELVEAVYDQPLDDGEPAPAKLRVLIQRCRDKLADIMDGADVIETKRGSGWRITKTNRAKLSRA